METKTRSVTVADMTAAREAAIECFHAVSYGRINLNTAKLVDAANAKMEGIVTAEEARVADEVRKRMEKARAGWLEHVKPIMDDIVRASARDEPVNVDGYKFSTAHEAAYYVVARKLREDGLIELNPYITDWFLPEPDEFRAMLDYEFRQTVAAVENREEEADNWITGKEAAEIICIDAANVGRNAGPEGSGNPIIDNGKQGTKRRYLKSSVADYAATHNQRKSASWDAEMNR